MLDTGERAPVTAAQVDEALEDFIDDPDDFKSFAHLLTRLEFTYGQDAAFAGQILDRALSLQNTWVRADELNPDSQVRFDAVLDMLVSDHYLTLKGNRVKWRYPTLQYIWARRRRKWERP